MDATYKKYHSSPKMIADRAARNKARAQLEKQGRVHKGDGKDVDHKNFNVHDRSPGNLRVITKSANRARKKANTPR